MVARPLLFNVLTGFKFIGEQIVRLEQQGRTDVLKFVQEDDCSIVIRPSSTEPKMKNYISVSTENRKAAERTEKLLSENIEEIL